MLYEIPEPPTAAALTALTKDLEPWKSVTSWGTYDQANGIFSKVGKPTEPNTQIPYKHRFVDNGSIFFATRTGDCDYSTSTKYKGLQDSVNHRRDPGDIHGVFAWTIANSATVPSAQQICSIMSAWTV